MWNGSLVVDAVAHAYDFAPDNRVESCPPEAYDGIAQYTYEAIHRVAESLDPGFMLTYEEFVSEWTPEDLASIFFAESDVDIIVYHGVALPPISRRGISPFEVGAALKASYPDRVLLYAPVDALGGEAELDLMAERAASHPIDGFKFYPANGILDPTGTKALTLSFADPEAAFPFFEQARSLGISHVAIHKAIPVGPGPLEPNNVSDIGEAATAFPDLTFEVVHSGWAFLEECALQMVTHPNIYANLECVANFAVRRPRRFAHVIGTLMHYAGSDRILFGTGAMAVHPAPVVQAFSDFVMPPDLIEGYGYQEVDKEVKAKIFGGNMCRLHGLDVDALLERHADDRWGRERTSEVGMPSTPWRLHRSKLMGAQS